MTLTVAYVADQSRVHQLLVSIASWMRFAHHPVAVVDIGLAAEGRSQIERLTDGRVTLLPPAETLPRKSFCQRTTAFEQKTLLGGFVPGDPVVFLDVDILVVHQSFLGKLVQVPRDTLWASRSAWDTDFAWSYTAESLPELRRATNQAHLDLIDPIVNSGVWAMRAETARRIAPKWNGGFRAAIDSPELSRTLRQGTGIGDQEFLLPACQACGVAWDPIHGAFNMQVHERRMPWVSDSSGHPRGGHTGEPAEPIRAIHYGCDSDGTIRLEPDMINCEGLRDWIAVEFARCYDLVRRRRLC